jgi:hypothetical protein
MADTIVEPDYHVTLPEEVRPHVSIGQRYVVTMSAEGNLVLTPIAQRLMADDINEILNRTAGLWQNRDDIPGDGIDYVNQLRQGSRLSDITELWNDR